MVKIISIVNQKGGVGKTTTGINIATSFAAIGKRTLAIDADAQGNFGTGFNISTEDKKENSIYHVFTQRKLLDVCIMKNVIDNLDIIPSCIDLSAVELELAHFKNREYVLKNSLENIKNKYEYVIIDCPPSLGLITVNALTASNSVIIPTQCEFFALEGLSHLLKTVSLIKKHLNKTLNIDGILLTMYDKRSKLNEQIENEIRKHLGSKVFTTTIPRNVRVSEAPSHGKPAVIYDVKCSGSKAYINLTKEMLEREKLLEYENE